MTTPVYRLKVRSHFCAAHQLRHYQGKCENLHGHNFIVEAEIEGRRLDSQTGILVDFKVLKKELKDVLEELDHCHLNELPEFKQQNPSSEHLARYIHRRLGQRLGSEDIRVRFVAVMESEGSTAVYLEE